MAVNVLIVNHTALMSGAEVTTLELLRERQDEFRYRWACPPGALADAASELGAEHVPLRGTAGSLRLSPRDTPVALAELVAMGVQVRRATARHRIHLIHAVSLRAGIVAGISRRLGGPPFLLYQHDVAPPGRVGAAVRALVDPPAARLVGCSQHVLDGLRREGWRTPGEVIPEPVDLTPYRGAAPANGARAELAPGPGPVVAEVAQITPWKGQDIAIRAMVDVRRRHPGARLVLVGDVTFAARATRFDNHAYLASLKRLVAYLGLEDAVIFAGRRGDMPAVMRSVDVLLLPSWEEPFGRVVAEGMAAGTPVVATTVGGPAETIRDGVDGLLAAPGDPAAWAAAVTRLLDDPDAARRMGERGRASVERFELGRFYPAIRAAHLEALRARRHPRRGEGAGRLPVAEPRPPAPQGASLRGLPDVAWAFGRPRVSVVIPTRDRTDALSETLAALDAQDCATEDVEIVVVDNAPHGATAAWLAGRRGRLRTEALVEPKPGPAAARNAGWRRAAAPVVLFLGDDTRPAGTGVVSAHLRLHAADPRPAMAVLGLIRWRADRPVTPFMHWLEHGGPQFNFDWLPAGPVSPPQHLYTPHVSIKRTALEQVGGFDERFPFAAFEDVELGLRLERAGLELIYHPELLVEHDHPYDPRRFGERQERVGASSRLMHAIHGDMRRLIGGPEWTWPAYRLARPLLEAAAGRTLHHPRARRYVWRALATAGYAAGWSRAEQILTRGRGAPGATAGGVTRGRPTPPACGSSDGGRTPASP